MKPRALLIVLSLGVLVATVAMVGRQHQQLDELRNQTQELQVRTEALTKAMSAAAEVTTPVVTEMRPSPSLELLRLRGQVGQLERRKRELSAVTADNQKLQTQLAAKGTNGTGGVALPGNYLRRSTAQLAGFDSPEATLQSIFWAVEHNDLPTLLQCLGPDQAKEMTSQIEKRGAEDFFKDAKQIPGLFITGRKQKKDGTIELTTQLELNLDGTIPAQPVRFKQFDGQWRMMSGM